MPLVSNLFRDNTRLNACLTSDPAHVVPGDAGEHVHLIQVAVGYLDGATIDDGELTTYRYGPSTANAVLAYKQKRNIINRAYQSTADNIVGKMTIAALDKEMANAQYVPKPATGKRCPRTASSTYVVERPRREFTG